MDWKALYAQLGEVKDAYLDPLLEQPDSPEELLQKIKDKELGTDWFKEETRKLNALKNLVPPEGQEWIGNALTQTGNVLNEAWAGVRKFEDPLNPLNLPQNVGAVGARGLEYFGQGVGLLSDGLSYVAHEGLRLDKPVADLTGTAASVLLTRKLTNSAINLTNKAIASKTAHNLAFRAGQKTSNLTQRFKPVNQRTVDVTSMRGNQIPSETSASVLGKKSIFRKGSVAESRAIEQWRINRALEGDPTSGVLLSVRPIADKGGIGDLLKKSNQPVSEILPHKSIREAGGVSLYNPDQAGAIQQLITQKIHTAMEAGPKFVREMFEEIWPQIDPNTLTALDMKKKLTIALGSKTKAGGPVATSNLDRGLAEILVGDKRFLHDIGAIDEVVRNPSVLEPKNISKWLGGIDSRVSSTKGGVALHHTTLTSSKPVLDNVDAQWRERFLNLTREKIIPGAEGIVKQDALAHKPFSSPKIKNKSGKLVTDNSKWNVKGVLGDVLDEFTDLPKSAVGDILVNKELGKLGNYSKGLEGQLQKLIRSINEKAAHATWSHGTTGWTLDSRLAQYSPEDAFSVAEYIFDLERTVSMQGIRVTQILNKWKKTISKGDFGQPPNLEKAIADLQRKIDNIRIDKSQIKAMEEAYKIRLDILLKEGPEALREFNTKALQGPRPAPDPVQ